MTHDAHGPTLPARPARPFWPQTRVGIWGVIVTLVVVLYSRGNDLAPGFTATLGKWVWLVGFALLAAVAAVSLLRALRQDGERSVLVLIALAALIAVVAFPVLFVLGEVLFPHS